MINIMSIFALSLLLVGVLFFSIWSNSEVYAQKSSSSTLSSPNVSKSIISPELKAKMCNPGNPDLKVVNTTEARICGISKTVKPSLPSPATPPTRAVSSSAPSQLPQQTTTAEPTTASVPIPPKKMATTNNISQGKGSTVAPISHSTATKSSLSPSNIAPQIKALNQHQQPQIREIKSIAPPQLNSVKEQQTPGALPITVINGTARINSTAAQNYAFAATSSVPNSDQQPLYLGYHPTSTNPTHSNSDSKHNDNHDSKSDSHSSTSDSSSKDKDTNDGSSAAKQKSSSTKPARTDTSNIESNSKNKNSHNTESSSDHTTDSASSSKDKKTKSDDGSSKENDDSSDATSSSSKSSSIIENDVSSVIVKSFNFKHSKDSDSSESSSIIENENDILPSVIVKSFNFR